MQTDATFLANMQHATLVGTMLALVAKSLKPVKVLSPCKRMQMAKKPQQCCDLLRPFAIAWASKVLRLSSTSVCS